MYGIFAVDAAFGNLRIVAVNFHHAKRKRSAVQNVVEAEMVIACYGMCSADTAMHDLFALPVNRSCSELCDV